MKLLMTPIESFNKLLYYLDSQKHKGYDPYDTLNSWFPFKLFGKWGPVLATQFQKRNPINIRPLLGIKKAINPKGFGLFLQAYSILYRKTGNEFFLKKADYFYEWLANNYTKGYSGKCWGYNFPWASKEKYLEPYTPSAVATGFVVNGLFEYHKIQNKPQIKELIESACQFLDKDLEKVHFNEGVSISYTPVQKDVCYNASLLAAEVFAKASLLLNNDAYRKIAIDAVEYVISRQKEDGHWKYSLDLKTGKEKHQVDFHQGYILESIHEIKEALKIHKENWEKAIKKGIDFYISRQFNADGSSLWRIPARFPVEIHNQSQGIITLEKLNKYHDKAQNFSRTILDWTIKNMQSKSGNFYYQKFAWYTNKISYMRWAQAWMLLAFANHIDHDELGKEFINFVSN
jgi:hypothetical protein